MDNDTKTYTVTVLVEYQYSVEAKSEDEAEQEGWLYEDYPFSASVQSIDIEEEEQDEA